MKKKLWAILVPAAIAVPVAIYAIAKARRKLLKQSSADDAAKRPRPGNDEHGRFFDTYPAAVNDTAEADEDMHTPIEDESLTEEEKSAEELMWEDHTAGGAEPIAVGAMYAHSGFDTPDDGLEPASADEEAAPDADAPASRGSAPAMEITSAAITDGVLADEYGAKGTSFVNGHVPSRSLPLSIRNIPEGTEAFAIVMLDPDGGNWIHWTAANIPVSANIPEDAGADWANRMIQGTNDFGTIGYGGPTPPSGTHAYVVTVYALSELLPLADGFKATELFRALDGKVLASASLTGRYSAQ